MFTVSVEDLQNTTNQFYTEFKDVTRLPVFIVDGERIWGLTATVLETVLHILREATE